MQKLFQSFYVVPYAVFKKDDGRIYVALQAEVVADLLARGANLTLLDNIGDSKNAENAMKALFLSYEEAEE